MNLIIVGCGRIGSELAKSSIRQGHQVTVVDRSSEAFERLGMDFLGRIIVGNVLDQEVLQRAGIEHADGLAAVTSDDATNFVVARAAKEIFQVPNVVARAYDPLRREAFETLGIRSIASSSWGAQRLYQLLTHPGQILLLTLGHGEISVVEIQVGEENQGATLSEFTASGYPVAVIRNGNALMPIPDLGLQSEDLVIMSLATQKLPETKEVG